MLGELQVLEIGWLKIMSRSNSYKQEAWEALSSIALFLEWIAGVRRRETISIGSTEILAVNKLLALESFANRD